jgi:hypothetical protein
MERNGATSGGRTILVIGLCLAAIVGLVAAGSALALTLGATSKHGVSRSIDGYFTPRDSIDLGNLSVDSGRYHLGYTFRVAFASAHQAATLRCGLVDPSGTIGYLSSNSFRVVTSNSKASTVTFVGDYSLPEMTVGVRCTPSRSGTLHIEVANFEITVEKRLFLEN